MDWIRRFERHVVSLFSNVPFLYSLIIALGCLLKSLAGETAVVPRWENLSPVRELAVLTDEIARVEDDGTSDGDAIQYLGAVPLPDGTALVVSARVSRPGAKIEPFVSRVLENGEADPAFGENGRLWLGTAPGKKAPRAAVSKEWTPTTGSPDPAAPMRRTSAGN